MEQRIWTARHTVRVAASPRRIYHLIANVDHYPRLFGEILSVEHLGYDGTNERVRFWGTFGDHRGSWVSLREINLKRMRVRFRQEHASAPLASLGGLWRVLPKGSGAEVVLDHYYRVVDDDIVAAQRLEQAIGRSAGAMLDALHEVTDEDFGMWPPFADAVRGLEGVS
ncbi:aromatase/cyclase [Actinophytocola sediminis]